MVTPVLKRTDAFCTCVFTYALEGYDMNFKLNGFVFGAMVAAVGMVTIAGTASAQSIFGDSIPGTFFAINDDNTETQEGRILGNGLDLGTRFSSPSVNFGTEFPFGTVNFWQQRGTVLTGGNSAGSELSFTGTNVDPAIVTTLTDLEAGTYEVEFIFLATRGNNNFQYRTGFEADSTSQILDTFDFTDNGGLVATEYQDVGVSGFVDGTLNVNVQAFGSFIGETTVGADGVLRVYTDTGQPSSGNRNLSSFAGLSLVQTSSAVPEPSSLALLGLFGGLGLIRRRR